MDFILRIYQSTQATCLASIGSISISNINLIIKDSKFDIPRFNKTSIRKYKFDISINGKFHKIGGSHSTPCITFKGNYIDIIVKNFPRYPAFAQDIHYARNWMNGYTTKYVGNGYPIWTEFRKYQIILL